MLWSTKYFQGLVSSIASLSMCLCRFLSGCPETLRLLVFQWWSLREPFGRLKYYCAFLAFFFLSFNKAVSSLCACPGNCSPGQFGLSQSLGSWQLQEVFPGTEFSDWEVTPVSDGTTLLLPTAMCQEHTTHKLPLLPRNVHSGSPPQPDCLSFPSGSFPHEPWTQLPRVSMRVRTVSVRGSVLWFIMES